jgi:hypothetical protein
MFFNFKGFRFVSTICTDTITCFTLIMHILSGIKQFFSIASAHKLKKEFLCAAALSGSSWYLSTLYTHPHFPRYPLMKIDEYLHEKLKETVRPDETGVECDIKR